MTEIVAWRLAEIMFGIACVLIVAIAVLEAMDFQESCEREENTHG